MLNLYETCQYALRFGLFLVSFSGSRWVKVNLKHKGFGSVG